MESRLATDVNLQQNFRGQRLAECMCFLLVPDTSVTGGEAVMDTLAKQRGNCH